MLSQKQAVTLFVILLSSYLAAWQVSAAQPQAGTDTGGRPAAAIPGPPTSTPTPPTTTSLRLAGHLGGRLSAIAGQGATLYLGIGAELAILDVSTPANQIPRRGYVVLPDLVTAVVVAGDIVYVTVEDHGLHAIDVSNPAAPVDLGEIDIPQPAGSLVVEEQIAYVALESGGVGVYDISDPSNPIELRQLDAGPGQIVAAGGYLHLPTGSGMTLWDIADPANPLEIGAYELPGPLQALVVRDGIAYVADTAALRIFDMSEPASPTELSFYATSAYMDIIYNMPGAGPGCQTTTLAVEENYAYINGCDGNQIVDISNPAQPTKAGFFIDITGSVALAMNGYGYVLGQDGLYVLDFSQPAAPREIGAYRTPPMGANEMVVADGYAYVAIPDYGVQIIDVSSPGTPDVAGVYQPSVPGLEPGLAVQDRILYLTDREALRIIDVSNPAAPVETGWLNFPNKKENDGPLEFVSVAVAGDYAYLVSRFTEATLWVVDISDPVGPVEVSVFDLSSSGAEDIAISGAYAYINAVDGLKVVDVSDPAAPVEAGVYVNEAGLVWSDLAVAGDYAYLGARYPSDLHVIDISDPAAPLEVGRYTPPGDGRAVAASGFLAYVMDEYRSVVKMVDIFDPANPGQAAFFDLPNSSGFGFGQVAAANGYVYADAGSAGLYILEQSYPVSAAPASPTPDDVSRIKAAHANQPDIRSPLLTPDGEWQATTVAYKCVEISPDEVLAYEELILTHLESGSELVVANQRQNCGGLGAAGLEALFWSPTGRYLYYTDARDGVPDGCGFWQPPLLRWDRAAGQTERLGGGIVSPDGRKLAVWPQRERAVALWDLDRGELGRVPAAADAFPGQMAWSPDSQAVVYLQVSSYCPLAGPSYLVRLDLETLEQTILLESERPTFHRVAWNKPGQLRLTDENEQVWTFRLDGQTLEPLADIGQQLAQIHAPFEFDPSGCFVINRDEVPYSYESAIEQMVALLVSHPARLSLAERTALFKGVTGFEVALFDGPDGAVLAAYPGNRGCPLGSHHFPGARFAVVDRSGNFWPIQPNQPGAVGRVDWIEDRWVVLVNHKLSTFSGPDPASVWHIGQQDGAWGRLVTHEFEPPPSNFADVTVRFQHGYEQMTVELSHWHEDPPCPFKPTFEQRFFLANWWAEKRYRLTGYTYGMLNAAVLKANVIDKATNEPAVIDWPDYCEEIPSWLAVE